jgi:2-deoxy-D-gluconate 3-dehydrogenase
MEAFVSAFPGIEGTTAVVTGASAGIGRAIAIGLAESGTRRIVGVSRSITADGDTAKAVQELGCEFLAIACDFADRPSNLALADRILAEVGSVDILVNNAGIAQYTPATDHPIEMWDEVMEVNLHAPWILTRDIGRSMIAGGGGKIVFNASLASFQGNVGVPSYTASKSAIAGVIRALGCEWAGMGVNVNGIAPGYTLTDITAPVHQDPVEYARVLDRTPANRWMDAADLVGSVLFLASSASSSIHGQIIIVDGGWMVR